MRVLIFGATGMVGSGVLIECLEDSRVERVLVVGRNSVGVQHPKLGELIHSDFFDYSGVETDLTDYDACFFCLGVTAAGKSEEDYSRLTYDLTLATATALARLDPEMTFCYVSGAGTDSSEAGRFMWARVKGRTENHLLRLPFHAAHMFRPGYIQPMKGVRSKTRWYQAMYSAVRPLYPLLRRIFPGAVTTTVSVGRAMIRVVAEGCDKTIIESRDINALAMQS